MAGKKNFAPWVVDVKKLDGAVLTGGCYDMFLRSAPIQSMNLVQMRRNVLNFNRKKSKIKVSDTSESSNE